MNTNKFTISWGDFSRYRSSMFGISIIDIMVFHYFEHIRSAHLLLKSEQFWYYYIGSTGVDFFLFLSGMGLFYSLTKNDDICQFYKKKTSQNPASLPACFDALFRLAGFYPLAHRHFDLYQGSALPQFYRPCRYNLLVHLFHHRDVPAFSPLVQILGYREPRKKISPPPGRFSYLCPFFMGPFCFESRNL